MPIRSSPFFQIENSPLLSLLRHTGTTSITSSTKHSNHQKKSSSSSNGNSILKIFKLIPMLSSGCNMVHLLNRHRKPLLKDYATTGTIFGFRKGRVFLTLQEDPHCFPLFIIELPMLTSTLQKEMASETVRIALESETKTSRKKVLEEHVWGIYCNGRKIGYSIRRKSLSEEERYVIEALKGVSMGAGVLPCKKYQETVDGEMTYMRARFDRVIGSKDSEALYMINPEEGSGHGTELSIFFLRSH